MRGIIKLLSTAFVGALFVSMIQSCSAVTPHKNFKNIFKIDIGKKADDPSSKISRYPEWFVDSRVLSNGNTELKYRWKDDCEYFYEIDDKTNIIGWRFEGSESVCVIAP